MYQGDYEQNRIILKNELDRKRIDGEKAEIVLYNADYKFLNSWNKDVRETRVIKTIYDNGQVNHGVYSGVDLDDKAPNNLENINSNNDYDALYNAFWCAESEVPTNVNETPCEIYIGGECVNDKALKEWAKNYDNLIMLEKELTIKFYADIEEKNIKAVDEGLQKSGAYIIVDNFPELSNIGNFNIKILGDSKTNDKKEIEIIFYANVDKNDLQSVKRGFQKCGADIITENFPELSNIGYFQIFESRKLNKLKLEENHAINEAIERRFNEEQEYDKFLNQYGEEDINIVNVSTEIIKEEKEKFLTSPPPPIVDGISFRINGLKDVTEREAKNYIDLVTKKIQENAKKSISSISISKQDDGHIKLDYVTHNEPFERIRRITGYLVGSMDKWNNAKRSEESERVKHMGKKDKNEDNNTLKDEKNVKQTIVEKIKPEIKEQDFFAAYRRVSHFPLGNFSKEEFNELDFMKEVIKEHGTNGNILQKAVQAVSDIKDQSPAFMAKLLNDTLKTEEYKNALNNEQNKSRDIER